MKKLLVLGFLSLIAMGCSTMSHHSEGVPVAASEGKTIYQIPFHEDDQIAVGSPVKSLRQSCRPHPRPNLSPICKFDVIGMGKVVSAPSAKGLVSVEFDSSLKVESQGEFEFEKK